jgi:hypothetical protein
MDDSFEITHVRDNPDGSAVYTFNLTKEQEKMFLLLGLRRAIEEGIKAGKEWDDAQENSSL